MKRINIKTKKNNHDKILIENENPHFIGAWNIENDDLCREIINFFEENKNLQRDGVTGSGKNQEIKKTTDIVVNPNDLKYPKFNCLNKYVQHLYKNFKDYQNQWPFLKNLIKEFINIDISKQFQNSDFGGDLTPAQLKYCANDVIYLHKIHEELNKILERENRLDLYKNCLKFLKTRVDLDLAHFQDDIWSH